MLDPRLALVGAALSLAGNAALAIQTIRGRARPNRVSWFLWAAVPFIAFFTQLDNDVGMAAVSTLAVAIGPSIIFVATFFNPAGVWRLTRFDFGCGGLAALALALWLIFDDPVLALLTSVLADLIGGLPTIRKAWIDPHSEYALVYACLGLNGGLTLLTVHTWDPVHYVFPLYLACLGAGLTAIVRFRR